MSLQAFCHVMFMCVVGFAVVLAVTEGTKPIASRVRFHMHLLATHRSVDLYTEDANGRHENAITLSSFLLK